MTGPLLFCIGWFQCTGNAFYEAEQAARVNQPKGELANYSILRTSKMRRLYRAGQDQICLLDAPIGGG
jgi:hypothetical protein